jgi:hypothetical protein
VFYLAYTNNILVFTNGSKEDYLTKVEKIHKKLDGIRLFLNLDKYEFVQKTVIYLGFIITAVIRI